MKNKTDELKKNIALLPRSVKIMEVCGTHTNAIAKYAVKSLLGSKVSLISGPGCPVCVTSAHDIDNIYYLSLNKGVAVYTFADMLRVQGNAGSLEKAREKGAKVNIIYSPLDAVKAAENTKEKVILIASGFETTAPLIAHCILEAKRKNLTNFLVYTNLKLICPAMRSLLSSDNNIDAFLLPGHVSIILGTKHYDFIAKEFHKRGAVGGFEEDEIIDTLNMIVKQILNNEENIKNAYSAVKEDGNKTAYNMMYDVFEEADEEWRGLGVIANSSLKMKEEFIKYNARKQFRYPIAEKELLNDRCLCGAVLQGKITPAQCPSFAGFCTPASPLGPCMVSSEGACNVYFNYRDNDNDI
ncbi:hydrogenase expression/formation protein HypD [Parelusimicrobium proximum]|uniref:hydrogenase formation protein HypD n=1 Tax=Parelusimicrobium proximum TaxID=3228953 RepID=UPI003D166B45